MKIKWIQFRSTRVIAVYCHFDTATILRDQFGSWVGPPPLFS
jgi:hypothetical protein